MLKRISARFAGDERISFVAIQTVFEGFEANTEDKVLETQRRYNLGLPMAHDGGTEAEPSRVMTDYRAGGTPGEG